MKKPTEKQKTIAKKRTVNNLKRAQKAQSKKRLVAYITHGKKRIVARYLKTKIK